MYKVLISALALLLLAEPQAIDAHQTSNTLITRSFHNTSAIGKTKNQNTARSWLRGGSGRKGQRGPKGHRGPRGHRGERGHKGDKGRKGEMGHKGKRGRRGSLGPQGFTGAQGDQGPEGTAFGTMDGSLVFQFITNSFAVAGQWQPFVIAPDGTQTFGPNITLADPSQTLTITVGPPIQIGVYTFVAYNKTIALVFNNVLYPSNVSVTNTSTNVKCFLPGPLQVILTAPGAFVETAYIPFSGP